MASQPKHITIARTQGPEAGLEFYMNAPSSRIHDAYKEIARKRTKASKLRTYCSLFADQLNSGAVSAVQVDKTIGDVQVLAERLAAILTGANGDEPEVEPEPEYSDTVMALATALNADPEAIAQVLGEVSDTPTTTAPAEPIHTNTEFITRDVAWAALGKGVDRPQASNRGDHASNAQLWRMNGGNGEFPVLFTPECVEFINGLATA